MGDERKSNAVYREGRVGSVRVEVLLDTGSNQTLIQRGLVAGGKAVEGEVVVRCAHGDTMRYPLVDVEMEIDGLQFELVSRRRCRYKSYGEQMCQSCSSCFVIE